MSDGSQGTLGKGPFILIARIKVKEGMVDEYLKKLQGTISLIDFEYSTVDDKPEFLKDRICFFFIFFFEK